MTTTLSLTQDNTMQALGDFLANILPTGVAVVRGQDNYVPEPKGGDFVVMTPLFRERLSTNVDTYDDGYPSDPAAAKNILSPKKVTIQIDAHGPGSADNAEIITAILRDDRGVELFAESGYDIAPLYCEAPRQLPFLNDQQQIEERWSIDVVLQCNPITTVAQDFAGSLEVGLVSVDATYPP